MYPKLPVLTPHPLIELLTMTSADNQSEKRDKRTIVVHPFVIATLPVVLLLAVVKNEILPEETLPGLVGLEIVVCVLLLICFGIFRNLSKAAVAASLSFILLFTYRVWEIFLGMSWPVVESQPWIPMSTFFLLVAGCVLFVMKGSWRLGTLSFSLDFERMNSVLNVISVLLFVINTIPLISYEMEMQSVVQSEVAQLEKPFAAISLDRNAPRPDIYYIIVDGFASPYTLDEFWHLKPPPFVDYLKNKGFYVVPKALSNYDRTELSLCSSLNMNYINAVHDRYEQHYKSDVPGLVLMRLIQDCATVRLFKQLGYRYVSVSSGSFGTDYILTADSIIKSNDVNHFVRAIAYLTPWWSGEFYVPWLRDSYCDTRLSAGTHMAEILANKSPKFVFIHTELSHAPNLFDAQGNRLKLPPGLIPVWEPPSACFDQWSFTVKQVESWIDTIIKATDGKAIIIVQSDHGPGLVMKKPADWYNERMRILNAYYLPEQKAGEKADQRTDPKTDLYPSITPVNSFRMIFRKYFGADMPILEDKSYCSPVWTKPFQWHDITKEVTFPSSSASQNKGQ
jgi:hypothetical protein